MKDVRSWLVEIDPLRVEGRLSPVRVEVIRHRVVTEAQARPPAHTEWAPGPILATIALAASLLAGIGLARVIPPAPAQPTNVSGLGDEQPTSSSEQRETQVRFTTPGGTQIVWVLNTHLDL